ncbi:hypothetical protein ALI22I_37320 [Saccharothrix sp. ALI-22-I]|uniref:hypothetical protein n=1 Tax=Saccharothrix sp. ALI-22-I TaxID=1933778 RepID=UPI00097CB857|nr:hypothetical protein [Saccharothrix sp. ALI-22-I]ONI81861.1 hypothetical protein ALI22I_37320 [Saccharothrix sp. ALI-22-I]
MRLMALPAAAVLVVLCAGPAFAQPATTPVPGPRDPNQPPVSAGPAIRAHAVGDAGTGLAVVRLAPDSTPTNTILPGFGERLGEQSAAEIGVGLASAQANTEAFLSYERAVAQASPLGFAVRGRAPQTPGTLVQTASPDNANPVTGGLMPPTTPLDALLKVGLLDGSVHARWNDELGPCVQPLADAKTSVATLSVLNAIPTLPSSLDLTGLLTQVTPKLDAAAKQSLIDNVKQLAAPLSHLGGLLSGTPGTGANGSLLSLPDTLSAHSTVELVDLPGSPNKAVRSTSTLQAASVRLLAGSPAEIRIDVVSQPTLVALSTGDKATSGITYTAPVLRVTQSGKDLGTLDAANPKLDVPIGVAPGEKLPRVGAQGLPKLDIGVLRLQIAQLNQRDTVIDGPLQQGGPIIKGYMLGATARLLDLQLLPTDALGLPNLPSALAQVSLGEQIVRAAAPNGGVVCAPAQAPPGGGGQAAPPKKDQPLAYTNAAYKTVPIFWTGTALLLIGVIIVAALPTRRRPAPKVTSRSPEPPPAV